MARIQQKSAGIKEETCHLTLTKPEMHRLNKFLRRRERFVTSYWTNYSRMSKQEAMREITGR